MYSHRKFTPGANLNKTPFANTSQVCPITCVPTYYNKNVPDSSSPSANVSHNIKVSQIINNSKGGKTQYGNFYLGTPLNVNYLGRMAGMPGGSGSPPINQFN